MTLEELIDKAKKFPLEPDPGIQLHTRPQYRYYDTGQTHESYLFHEFLTSLQNKCSNLLTSLPTSDEVKQLQTDILRTLCKQSWLSSGGAYLKPTKLNTPTLHTDLGYVQISFTALSVSHILDTVGWRQSNVVIPVVKHYEHTYGPPTHIERHYSHIVNRYPPPPQAKNIFTLLQWLWHEFPKFLLLNTPFQDYSNSQLL